MLIRNLEGLFTCKGFAENGGRRPTLAQADFVRGPVDIYSRDGVIVEIGRNLTVPSECEIVDGSGKVALPGFVDSHTHAVFAGNRAGEFFQRWAGQSYVDIAKAGGGIKATQRWTAEASGTALVAGLVTHLRAMRAAGTVAVEIKSGYGRSAEEELRLLRVIRDAAAQVPEIKVASTFLALHALPEGRTERDFTDEMIAVLPPIAAEGLATFADTFPERGFFSLEEAVRFSKAAQEAGLKLKVHAEELSHLGTSEAFIALGATSIDHLQHISDAAIESLCTSETVATLLPATSFYLGLSYGPARRLIDAGAQVALATDFNPGTAPSHDLRFTALLAASQLKMTAAEILCAITVNAALALDLSEQSNVIAIASLSNFNFIPGCDSKVVPEVLLERYLLNGFPVFA